MTNKDALNIESALEDFGSMLNQDYEPNEKKAITLWLPKSTVMKYEKIQSLSRRKLSKKIKEIVIKSIDLVDLEAI